MARRVNPREDGDLGHARVDPNTVQQHQDIQLPAFVPHQCALARGLRRLWFLGPSDRGYSHTNDAIPHLVNEDVIRTWTLSSALEFDPDTKAFRTTDQVSVTVKRKSG